MRGFAIRSRWQAMRGLRRFGTWRAGQLFERLYKRHSQENQDLFIIMRNQRPSRSALTILGDCLAKNPMTLVHNRCRFADKQIVRGKKRKDKQIVRLQETPDEIPKGGTPHRAHTVSLLMHDKLVDAGKPGDRVEVTGICRTTSVSRPNP